MLRHQNVSGSKDQELNLLKLSPNSEEFTLTNEEVRRSQNSKPPISLGLDRVQPNVVPFRPKVGETGRSFNCWI